MINGELYMEDNMELLFEIHRDLPRAGPGSNASTKKAFSMLKNLPPQLKILDIGCGPGMQTIQLAKLIEGEIIAVDIYQPFLDRIQQKAEEEGVSAKIRVMNKSMLELDFKQESFDIIWAEGAIFIIGFDKGLEAWQGFLKRGGSIGVSELTWFANNPPEEIKSFLEAEYPAIQTQEGNLRIIKKLGYKNIRSFLQPESDWYNYYDPMEKEIQKFRAKYEGNSGALEFLDRMQREIDLFRNYSKYYGYNFYLMQR